MTVELVVLGLVLVVIALVFASTVVTGAPPLPTSPQVRAAMLAQLPETVAGPVLELGCGWGGLAVALARRFPDVDVVGYELSLLPWAVARLRQWLSSVPNLTIRFGSFLNADLGDGAVVVCFLSPPMMEKLKPKLDRELTAGALVLSNTFAIRGWQPESVATVDDLHQSKIYLYRISAEIDA